MEPEARAHVSAAAGAKLMGMPRDLAPGEYMSFRKAMSVSVNIARSVRAQMAEKLERHSWEGLCAVAELLDERFVGRDG